MKPASKARFGFTLIELILILAIIGVLSGFVVANFSSIGKQQFSNVAEEMVSNLRFIQNNALSGIKDPCNNSYPPTQTLRGWYIKLKTNSNSYEIGNICKNVSDSSLSVNSIQTINIGSFKIKGASKYTTSWTSTCPSNPNTEDVYYVFESVDGLLLYASDPTTSTIFIKASDPTTSTTAFGILLQDPNYKNPANQYKGIGISAVGGMTLRDLPNWTCNSNWSNPDKIFTY